MAKKSWLERNKRKSETVKKFAAIRAELKAKRDYAGLAKLPRDRTPMLYCKTGVRSAEALAAVRKAGFADAVHLQGGIVAWAQQMQPDMVMY